MKQLTKPHVLIVDDQPNWRILFEELLAEEYNVTSVESYEAAAVALMSSHDNPFHVAIVDIRLDDADKKNEKGMEIAHWLTKNFEITNVIIVTGYPTLKTIKRAWKVLGVFDYAEKYPEDGSQFERNRFRDIVDRAARDAHRRRFSLKCDRGKICSIIDDNSTEREIRSFQQALRRMHNCPEFASFDALRGPAKWDKIDHLLEIWETHDELCIACQIFRTEIRPGNEKLELEFQAICSQ